jgi:hypothetical protein
MFFDALFLMLEMFNTVRSSGTEAIFLEGKLFDWRTLRCFVQNALRKPELEKDQPYQIRPGTTLLDG